VVGVITRVVDQKKEKKKERKKENPYPRDLVRATVVFQRAASRAQFGRGDTGEEKVPLSQRYIDQQG